MRRDGFSVRDFDGTEVHFVPCEYSDRRRELALSGLLRQTNTERWTVVDTRDEGSS